MARHTRKAQGGDTEKVRYTIEDLDKAEGWVILKRFKNKAEMAAYANNPADLADLEYQYPLENYRRKLDLDNCYLAVLRR